MNIGPVTGASLLMLVLMTSAGRGDDKIVIQPEGSTSRIAIPCTIVDYTGVEITIRPRSGGPPKSYPSSQVVEVRTTQTAAYQHGMAEFEAARVVEAQKSFEQALAEDSRVWVRREILAMLVRCSLRLQDYSQAASRFLLLVQSDPMTVHYKAIPLLWAPVALNVAERSDARLWMNQSSDVAALLGASYLLDDPNQGQLAEEALRRLGSAGNIRIRQLARAQLWRVELRSPGLTSGQLELWDERISAMSHELRGGPFYLLGQGYYQRRQFDRAAMAFLWLPLVYFEDHQLSARACLYAANALAEIRQSEAANTLYREVQQRFGDTPFAQEAAAKLNRVSTGNQPPVEVEAARENRKTMN